MCDSYNQLAILKRCHFPLSSSLVIIESQYIEHGLHQNNSITSHLERQSLISEKVPDNEGAIAYYCDACFNGILIATLLFVLAHWNNHHLLTVQCHSESSVQVTLVVGYHLSVVYFGGGGLGDSIILPGILHKF